MKSITITHTTKYWMALFLMLLFLYLMFSCAEVFSPADDDSIAIDSISPAAGYPGSTFRVYGRGFGAVRDSNRVFVNGTRATIQDPTSLNVLLVTVPAKVTTGPVSLHAFNRTVTGPVFTVGSIPQIDNVVQVTAASGDLTHIVFNLLITGDHFSIDTKHVKLYYGGESVPILGTRINENGKPQLFARIPAYNEDNPAAIVIESDGIKSLPYIYTTKPVLDDWDFSKKYDGTYTYLKLTGGYFGFDQTGNEIVVSTQGILIHPDIKIESWSFDTIYVRLKIDLGRYYEISVKVNGVESSSVRVLP